MSQIAQITKRIHRNIFFGIQDRIETLEESHYSNVCDPRDVFSSHLARAWYVFGAGLYAPINLLGMLGESLGWITGLIASLMYCLFCCCACNDIKVGDIIDTCTEVGELTFTLIGLPIGCILGLLAGSVGFIYAIFITLCVAICCPCWCCNTTRRDDIGGGPLMPQSAADMDDLKEEKRNYSPCCC